MHTINPFLELSDTKETDSCQPSDRWRNLEEHEDYGRLASAVVSLMSQGYTCAHLSFSSDGYDPYYDTAYFTSDTVPVTQLGPPKHEDNKAVEGYIRKYVDNMDDMLWCGHDGGGGEAVLDFKAMKLNVSTYYYVKQDHVGEGSFLNFEE